ncbi:hypothetical protein [Haloarcula saliterrae]
MEVELEWPENAGQSGSFSIE